MTEIYNKIDKLDLSKWILTRFFHYRAQVTDKFGERDEMWHSKPLGDEEIKNLYDHFYLIYHRYHKFSGLPLADNKTICEIMNIETGEKLYLGKYDGKYSIGKSYWSEFGNVTEIIPNYTKEI